MKYNCNTFIEALIPFVIGGIIIGVLVFIAR
jgi:hypothetical protein